jgi:translation initiation factor eIF-2B subunit alpha
MALTEAIIGVITPPMGQATEVSVAESVSSSSVVVQDLQTMLQHHPVIQSLFDESVPAVSVAAIKALLGVVQRSQAETMMGLQDELRKAAEDMTTYYRTVSHTIALQSGIELFLQYVTRTNMESPSFADCKSAVLERGERFQTMSLAARFRVAAVSADFIHNNTKVLTLGFSRVVAAVLTEAWSRERHFELVILHDGKSDGDGMRAAQSYAAETSIPVTLVPDAAAGYIMESVDIVLIGAEGVAENGGIINKLGTLAVATCAAAYGKPVYVAAESYKFARLFPLKQKDLPIRRDNIASALPDQSLDKSIRVMNPTVDFTPAKYITLLFTDLGVLTPSAVSDELIRLYQ